jgi:hypothetical protein
MHRQLVLTTWHTGVATVTHVVGGKEYGCSSVISFSKNMGLCSYFSISFLFHLMLLLTLYAISVFLNLFFLMTPTLCRYCYLWERRRRRGGGGRLLYFHTVDFYIRFRYKDPNNSKQPNRHAVAETSANIMCAFQ